MAEFYALDLTNVPATSLGASDSLECEEWTDKNAVIYGGGTWNLDIQVSTDDGTTWIDFATSLVSGELIEIPLAVSSIRANVISWTSGTPTVRISGWTRR